jgi:putative oxidoreductase
MKWAVVIARTLLGLVFLVFGLDYFLHFMNPVTPELPDPAMQFVGALAPSGYFKVIKVLEVVGGLLLVTGLFVPLGITILTPIIVNIVLFEVFLAEKPGMGVALLALAAFLIVGYWNHFKSVFAPRAAIGCGCAPAPSGEAA